MLGPFMQGFLLLGILYWYSKGLINIINDYYRKEFNIQLKMDYSQQQQQEQQEQVIGLESTLHSPITYDLDDIEILLKICDEEQEAENTATRNLTNGMKECLKSHDYERFMLIVLKMINEKKNESLNLSMCWSSDNDVT